MSKLIIDLSEKDKVIIEDFRASFSELQKGQTDGQQFLDALREKTLDQALTVALLVLSRYPSEG